MLASGERRLLLSCCATMISVRHPLLELVNSLNDGKMDDSATFMPVKLISQVKYKSDKLQTSRLSYVRV